MITIDHPLAQLFTEFTCIVITVLAVVYPRNLRYNFSSKCVAASIECRSEAVDEPIYRHNHCVHASNWHMYGTA